MLLGSKGIVVAVFSMVRKSFTCPRRLWAVVLLTIIELKKEMDTERADRVLNDQ